MNDRENVINILLKYKNHAFGDKDEKVTVEEIIALLKAQEPVLAVKLQSKKYIGRTGIAYDGSCGNCNSYLMRGWMACPICGKAVKWE